MAERWSEIRAALTEEERREIVWALVHVTIGPTDEVTVTGRLADLGGCTEKGMVGDTGLEPVASSV